MGSDFFKEFQDKVSNDDAKPDETTAVNDDDNSFGTAGDDDGDSGVITMVAKHMLSAFMINHVTYFSL